MNQETERKNKIISGIYTTVICIGIFLLFWFYNFNYEMPVIPEKGILAVSLGEPDAGGPEEVPIEAESSPSVPKMSAPETVEQTKDPDAVAIKKAEETKKKQEQTTETEKEKDNLLDDLLKGKKNQKSSPSGDEEKTGPQGDKKGDETGVPKGTVGGGGPGTTHTFGNRKFNLGTGKNSCNQEGKVILEVTLLPDGKIKYEGVSPASSGSACLENVAISYLRSSSFNASQNPVSVEGTITFNFKLK